MLTNVRRSLVYASTVYATTRTAVTTAYALFRATIWVQTEPVASVSNYYKPSLCNSNCEFNKFLNSNLIIQWSIITIIALKMSHFFQLVGSAAVSKTFSDETARMSSLKRCPWRIAAAPVEEDGKKEQFARSVPPEIQASSTDLVLVQICFYLWNQSIPSVVQDEVNNLDFLHVLFHRCSSKSLWSERIPQTRHVRGIGKCLPERSMRQCSWIIPVRMQSGLPLESSRTLRRSVSDHTMDSLKSVLYWSSSVEAIVFLPMYCKILPYLQL